MGYYSRLSGRLTIEPALSPSRVPFALHGLLRPVTEDREVTVYFGPDAEQIQLPYLVGAQPADDSVKAYDLEAEIRALVAAIPDGHTISGAIVRSGEDQGDVERFIVGDSGAIRIEKARPSWPDGSAVDQ